LYGGINPEINVYKSIFGKILSSWGRKIELGAFKGLFKILGVEYHAPRSTT